MELENILEWLGSFICENPIWSIIGAILTPTGFIQLRKFYLEYFSRIKIEILKVRVLPNSANRNIPIGKIYFGVETRISRKTRKTIHLNYIECRIISDTIITDWHLDNWAPHRITLENGRTKEVNCNFFERPDLALYQFEVRIIEDGTKKTWTSKSKKYKLENSQLIEI